MLPSEASSLCPRHGFAALVVCVVGVALGSAAGCSSSDSGGPPPSAPAKVDKPSPTPMPPLGSAVTTAVATLVPTHARQSYKDGPNPATSADALASYLDRGFGELGPAAAQPYVTRVIDAAAPGAPGAPPAPGPSAKRIVRFAHLSDLQLMDDESPTRLALYDSADMTSSAARPDDAYICRMTNAAVRTINAMHRKDPIAFTLLGGDNADSAQSNEVDWVLQILAGSPLVQCDSAEIDDPVPGPDNDGKDPFVAEGLLMPWKWNTGNHDVLITGNLAISDAYKAAAIGDTPNGGTRDYRSGGAITTETIAADARRAPLTRADLIAKVASDGDGHGLGAEQRASGRATYSFDVEGTPLRFVVIDTAHETGGSDGVIKQSYVSSTIKPLLDKAKSDGKWVVLASHHAVSALTLDGGAFGKTEPDALSPEAWSAFVGGYPNVVLSMVGHAHQNRARAISPVGGHAWWEVMTASIADFPHQLRVVEIYDQDNGWIMVRAAAVDFGVESDAVAKEGRRRGVVDLTSGWSPHEPEEPEDRNVELWIKTP